MVNLTYTPTPFDLESSLVQILKQIWTYDTHSDKHECVDCLMFEEWCISYARTKWEPDFVDFDSALYKFQFHRKKYLCLMSLRNEEYKEQLVESILRGER